jgi:hypothetical protein
MDLLFSFESGERDSAKWFGGILFGDKSYSLRKDGKIEYENDHRNQKIFRSKIHLWLKNIGYIWKSLDVASEVGFRRIILGLSQIELSWRRKII